MFEIGDRVRVVREAGYGWVYAMNETVGKAGVVTGKERTIFLVCCDGSENTWWYSREALEKCTDAECSAQEAKVGFKVGDTVLVHGDMDCGGWVPRMVETIGCTGRVLDIGGAGILVGFGGGCEWWYSAGDLRAVTEPGAEDIGVGDRVKVMLKHDSPRGTRCWVSTMDKTIGEEGWATKIDGDFVKVILDDETDNRCVWWYLRKDLKLMAGTRADAKHRIGDSVKVTGKAPSLAHVGVPRMDKSIGRIGKVVGLEEDDARVCFPDGRCWWYSNSALQGVPGNDNAKWEFQPGDFVKIVGKCEHQRDWIPDMGRTIGQYGKVLLTNPPLDSDGNRYRVEFPTGMSFWYNVEALQLAEQLVAKASLPVKSLSCPCVEWLGIWLTPDRKIREVVWDEFVWRVYARDEDHGKREHCDYGRYDASPDWQLPDNWTRPVNGPRLSRPKSRSRINIGWDPMDEG